METKIGEAQAKVAIGIEKEKEPRILLRANYKNVNKTNEVTFNLTEDLKIGDKIKVTIEKISTAPKKADKG